MAKMGKTERGRLAVTLAPNPTAAWLLNEIMFVCQRDKLVEWNGNRFFARTTGEWAAETGLTASQVKRSLASLREAGLIETEQHIFAGKTVNHVRPTLPEQDPPRETRCEPPREGAVSLMPGVEELLVRLEQEEKRRCVVTHSPKEQVDMICDQLPILKTIPVWITREDYSRPKPDPEGYQKALKMLERSNDRIIGFEDTFKGFQALQGVPCHPVIISAFYKPDASVSHFESFEKIESIL